MVDFPKLTADNINMFAMKHYDNPTCIDEKEFLDDMKRFKYLKRLFRKFDTTKELKTRLILNHIIVLNNVFGPEASSTLLLFKIEKELWTYLKPFMELLNILPSNELKEIKNDELVEQRLKVL